LAKLYTYGIGDWGFGADVADDNADVLMRCRLVQFRCPMWIDLVDGVDSPFRLK